MVKRLVVFVIASVIALSGCERKETVIPTLAEPVSTDIDTAMVSRGDIFELSTYDAKVYPDIQEVSYVVDGTVKNIAAYLGQEVKEGELLIQLDEEELRKELTKQKEELEVTEKNNALEIQTQILDIQILELSIQQKKEQKAPQIEMVKLEADLEKRKLIKEQTLELQEFFTNKTKRRIEKVEAELNQYKLLAPCSGRIVYMKNMNRNSRISAKETVIMIADDSKLHIQSAFISGGKLASASQVYALIKGKQYDLNYIPFDTDELIKMNNSGIELETRYEFKEDSDINSGDYACVCLVEKLKTDVLMIPKNALYNDSDGDFVYRILDGELVKCNVEIGTKTKIQVEIISGLAEGDVVYVQK